MMLLQLAFLLASFFSAAAHLSNDAAPARAQFNNTKCPSFHELRAPHVLANFNKERDIPGFYYELALHDVTQFPLCPTQPRCISSNKTLADLTWTSQ